MKLHAAKMNCQVELIPVTEGNHVTVKEDEKLIVGRGSSLGVRLKQNKLFCVHIFLIFTCSVMIKKSRDNMRN